MLGKSDSTRLSLSSRLAALSGVEWSPTNTLTLTNRGPAARVHPETGVAAWHAHAFVLHESAWRDGFAWAARHHEEAGARRAAWRFLARRGACALVDWLERAALGLGRLGQHATHADGGEIAREDFDAARRLAWHHARVFAHEPGDVHVVDNFRAGHARMAYEWRGARELLASWTGGYGAENLVAAT